MFLLVLPPNPLRDSQKQSKTRCCKFGDSMGFCTREVGGINITMQSSWCLAGDSSNVHRKVIKIRQENTESSIIWRSLLS